MTGCPAERTGGRVRMRDQDDAGKAMPTRR